MWRFILVSFAFMGWAFWELSGGADYEPREGSLQAVARDRAVQPVTDTGDAAGLLASAADRRGEDVSRLNTRNIDITLASARAPLDEPAEHVQVFSPRGRLFSEPVLTDLPVLQPAAAVEPAQEADLRAVSGNRVNMRNGPGTSFGVLGTLPRGERVLVLEGSGTGWVKLRVEDSGREGWMAESLLTSVN